MPNENLSAVAERYGDTERTGLRPRLMSGAQLNSVLFAQIELNRAALDFDLIADDLEAQRVVSAAAGLRHVREFMGRAQSLLNGLIVAQIDAGNPNFGRGGR